MSVYIIPSLTSAVGVSFHRRRYCVFFSFRLVFLNIQKPAQITSIINSIGSF